MRTFKGTEYTVIGCFQDQDSINLLVQLDKVLSDAGWTRDKLPSQNSFGDIQLNIAKDFSVPITTRTGVYVGAQSIKKLDELKSTPIQQLPAYIRAAMALKGDWLLTSAPMRATLAPSRLTQVTQSVCLFSLGKSRRRLGGVISRSRPDTKLGRYYCSFSK